VCLYVYHRSTRNNRRNVGHVDFYAVRVVSNESRLSALPRTYCLLLKTLSSPVRHLALSRPWIQTQPSPLALPLDRNHENAAVNTAGRHVATLSIIFRVQKVNSCPTGPSSVFSFCPWSVQWTHITWTPHSGLIWSKHSEPAGESHFHDCGAPLDEGRNTDLIGRETPSLTHFSFVMHLTFHSDIWIQCEEVKLCL
jgi:hypothetical protein